MQLDPHSLRLDSGDRASVEQHGRLGLGYLTAFTLKCIFLAMMIL